MNQQLLYLFESSWFYFREQKDPHFLREKVNSKQAKDMFERAQQVEQEFRSVFTGKLLGL